METERKDTGICAHVYVAHDPEDRERIRRELERAGELYSEYCHKIRNTDEIIRPEGSNAVIYCNTGTIVLDSTDSRGEPYRRLFVLSGDGLSVIDMAPEMSLSVDSLVSGMRFGKWNSILEKQVCTTVQDMENEPDDALLAEKMATVFQAHSLAGILCPDKNTFLMPHDRDRLPDAWREASFVTRSLGFLPGRWENCEWQAMELLVTMTGGSVDWNESEYTVRESCAILIEGLMQRLRSHAFALVGRVEHHGQDIPERKVFRALYLNRLALFLETLRTRGNKVCSLVQKLLDRLGELMPEYLEVSIDRADILFVCEPVYSPICGSLDRLYLLDVGDTGRREILLPGISGKDWEKLTSWHRKYLLVPFGEEQAKRLFCMTDEQTEKEKEKEKEKQ